MEKPQPRQTRRLSDKILIAFHQACDQVDIEVAGELLNVLEFMIKRTHRLPIGANRRTEESLVAAHERLWQNPAPWDLELRARSLPQHSSGCSSASVHSWPTGAFGSGWPRGIRTLIPVGEPNTFICSYVAVTGAGCPGGCVGRSLIRAL